MLIGLKVSSLTCKGEFYRTELNAKRGIPLNWVLKALKWSKPKNRAQRIDEKNGVICLVIVFTSRVMAILLAELWPSRVMELWPYYILITAKN